MVTYCLTYQGGKVSFHFKAGGGERGRSGHGE